MNKPKMKRVGRHWIDKELLKEGYNVRDIFEGEDDPVIELPELIDREKRKHVGWMICPKCGEREQVDRRHLACRGCGWEQSSSTQKPTKCAA